MSEQRNASSAATTLEPPAMEVDRERWWLIAAYLERVEAYYRQEEEVA